MKYLLIVLFVLTAQIASAQQTQQTQSEKLWDITSYITVASNIAGDAVVAWRTNDEEKKTAVLESTARTGVAIGASLLIKYFIEKERPDKSDNKSFWSMHTCIAASNQGWNWKIGVPLTGITALGRFKARKHDWIDLLAGLGCGLATQAVIRFGDDK